MSRCSVSTETGKGSQQPQPHRSKKRKLMPLRNRYGDCAPPPIDEFGPKDKLRVECPSALEDKDENKAAVPKGLKQDGIAMVDSKGEVSRDKNQRGKSPSSTKTIVCTFMHRGEVEWVQQAVEKLGGFETELKVSSKTTHVICGDEKRTANVMRGIAYGCWILRSDWVKESQKVGIWVGEEPYEVQSFPAARQCRVARETMGTRSNIFDNGHTYYISSKTSPPNDILRELLQLCGAKIVDSAMRANVIIASSCVSPLPGVIQVNEKWVCDSIVQNMLQQKSKYLHKIVRKKVEKV